MTGETGSTTFPAPPVLWAQNKSAVYLKVALEDCKNPTIDLKADSLHFKGTGGVDAKPHEVTLHFLHPIKPDSSKYVVRPRGTEFVLAKAEPGPFWKRLLQEETKFHWLKVDFNKWVDEDDSGDELGPGSGGGDFEEMMRSMGGLGDDDMPDMDPAGDSDDEEIPDLESSNDGSKDASKE
uniref:Putative hsp90 co-chaperone p23 n=1 Tax=Ixodes ricinus TaxID=34613 RepID=A0A147BGB5_IXORI